MSLVQPELNYLWASYIDNADIDFWLQHMETLADHYPCSSEMTYDDWLRAIVATRVYSRYLLYIERDVRIGAWGDEVDLGRALNGMYEVWGIQVLPLDGHEIRFEYEYLTDIRELKWTPYIDDCSFGVSYYQIRPLGGFINSEEELSGTIVIN